MAKLLGHDLITIVELNAFAQQMAVNLMAIQTRLDKLRNIVVIGGIVLAISILSIAGFLLFKH